MTDCAIITALIPLAPGEGLEASEDWARGLPPGSVINCEKLEGVPADRKQWVSIGAAIGWTFWQIIKQDGFPRRAQN